MCFYPIKFLKHFVLVLTLCIWRNMFISTKDHFLISFTYVCVRCSPIDKYVYCWVVMLKYRFLQGYIGKVSLHNSTCTFNFLFCISMSIVAIFSHFSIIETNMFLNISFILHINVTKYKKKHLCKIWISYVTGNRYVNMILWWRIL